MSDNYSEQDQGYRGIFDISIDELMGEAKTTKEKCHRYVVEQFIKLLHEYYENIFIHSHIENLPDNILDYLAIEWDLPYYEDSLDRATKIRLVKEGYNWRRTAGTIAGVETLVQKMFGEGVVSEWYEYGGDPGKFKITTTAPLVEDMEEFFRVLLRKEKNARSWLEYIDITRDSTFDLPIAGWIHQAYRHNTVASAPLT